MDNWLHNGTILCRITYRGCCRSSVLLHHRWACPDGQVAIAAEIEVSRCSVVHLTTESLPFHKYEYFLSFAIKRMPFDTNTYCGFIVVLVSGLICGITYLAVTIAVASLFLSMGLYLEAFRSHFESIFRNMTELVGKHTPDAVNQIRLKACLIEAIQLHNQARE